MSEKSAEKIVISLPVPTMAFLCHRIKKPLLGYEQDGEFTCLV